MKLVRYQFFFNSPSIRAFLTPVSKRNGWPVVARKAKKITGSPYLKCPKLRLGLPNTITSRSPTAQEVTYSTTYNLDHMGFQYVCFNSEVKFLRFARATEVRKFATCRRLIYGPFYKERGLP